METAALVAIPEESIPQINTSQTTRQQFENTEAV